MSQSKRGANTGSTAKKLPLDRIHHLLSAQRRRYTLYYLYLYENPARLPDVADQVTEWEQSESHLPEDRLQTYNALYHNHIPKLADVTVVTYRQSEDLVGLAENGAQLRPYLEQAAETDLDAADSVKL